MSSLPQELWSKILEIGIENSGLTYKDLCCISISCRLFHRLSSEDSLWNHLLSTDFPISRSYFTFWNSKLLYSSWVDRNKERILHEHQQQQQVELSKQHYAEDLNEKKRLSRIVGSKELYQEKVVKWRQVEFNLNRQVEFNRLKREREKMRKWKYYLQLEEAERKKQEETERLAKLAEAHDKLRKREIEIAGLYHKKW